MQNVETTYTPRKQVSPVVLIFGAVLLLGVGVALAYGVIRTLKPAPVRRRASASNDDAHGARRAVGEGVAPNFDDRDHRADDRDERAAAAVARRDESGDEFDAHARNRQAARDNFRDANRCPATPNPRHPTSALRHGSIEASVTC